MKLNHYIFFRSARHSLWFCNSVRMTLWIASSLKMFEMGAIFYRTDQVITDLNVHFDCVFAIQMAAITNNGSNREIHLWTVNSLFGRSVTNICITTIVFKEIIKIWRIWPEILELILSNGWSFTDYWFHRWYK